MVPRQSFINKIEELGYYYRNQQKRTQLFRKRGGTHRMFVPLKQMLDDDNVKSLLSQAGCSPDEIQKFLSSAKV